MHEQRNDNMVNNTFIGGDLDYCIAKLHPRNSLIKQEYIDVCHLKSNPTWDMVKMNILINARGCACNFHRMSIRYVTPLVSAMSIKTRAMVDVLHSDRYPHCNSRANFTNLAKHFAVHGSWNIWVDVPAIITACYISQFGYESREIHCKTTSTFGLHVPVHKHNSHQWTAPRCGNAVTTSHGR